MDDKSVVAGSATRLQLLKSRLKIAKDFCKKPHDTWKAWTQEYNISNWDDTASIKDTVRIGYVFRKVESDLPAIFDDQPDVFIKGRNAQTKEVEPIINSIYDYLWDVQELEEKLEDVGTYFILLGMGFISSPWVTKTKQVQQLILTPTTDAEGKQVLNETGQPQMEESQQPMEVPIVDNPQAIAENPFKLYFSPETKFSTIMDYEHCPYYFKEMTMTQDEIKAKFGKEIDSAETLKLNNDDDSGAKVNKSVEYDPVIVKDDLKRSTVYEYYGSLPEEYAKDIKDEDGSSVPWAYDKDYHIFLTSNEELEAEECEYDVKPLFVVGNYGLANKFWRFGEAKHLMPLIQEKEFYRTQVLKHTRKMANPKALLPVNAQVDEDNFRNPKAGSIVKFAGPTAPAYLQPSSLGKEVFEGINLVETDLEKQSATFDLGSGGAQSTVKTPKGIEVYAAAADKNIERKRKKMARLIKHLIIFQFKQLAQNWKPDDAKVIPVLSGNEITNLEVGEQVLQLIGGVGQLYNLDIEIESMSMNRALQKQDAIDLFTLATQNPFIFDVQQMAKDLLMNGYGKKDPDRYMLPPDKVEQVLKMQMPRRDVRVTVQADAATPVGERILENENIVKPQQVMANSVRNQPTPPELDPNHPNLQQNQLIDPNTGLPPAQQQSTQSQPTVQPTQGGGPHA